MATLFLSEKTGFARVGTIFAMTCFAMFASATAIKVHNGRINAKTPVQRAFTDLYKQARLTEFELRHKTEGADQRTKWDVSFKVTPPSDRDDPHNPNLPVTARKPGAP